MLKCSFLLTLTTWFSYMLTFVFSADTLVQ